MVLDHTARLHHARWTTAVERHLGANVPYLIARLQTTSATPTNATSTTTAACALQCALALHHGLLDAARESKSPKGRGLVAQVWTALSPLHPVVAELDKHWMGGPGRDALVVGAAGVTARQQCDGGGVVYAHGLYGCDRCVVTRPGGFSFLNQKDPNP